MYRMLRFEDGSTRAHRESNALHWVYSSRVVNSFHSYISLAL